VFLCHMKEKINIVITEVFHVSLITYVLFLLVEIVYEDFIRFFFNLNILLGIVLVSGIASTLFATIKEESKKHTGHKELDRFVILIFSVGGGFIVLQKTYDIGFMSLVISLATALIIAFLSHLILSPETSEK
jgi:hypothetical protein